MAAQKDLLSAQASNKHAFFLLYCLFDWVIRKYTHDNRCIKWSEATALQDLDLAEHLAILCHSLDDQQELTDELVRTDGTVGLFAQIQVNGSECW